MLLNCEEAGYSSYSVFQGKVLVHVQRYLFFWASVLVFENTLVARP